MNYKTIDELFDDAGMLAKFQANCASMFGGPAGHESLGMLNKVIPPYMSPRNMAQSDDPVTLAYFEGLRDMSAFLYRMSRGKPPATKSTET